MSDTIQRADLFDAAADFNSRGFRINFKIDGEPNEELVTKWAQSIIWKTETSDRAKQKTGAGTELDKDFVGHVQIARDSEAKGNTSGLEANTTKVVHARQLPTVAGVESTIDDFTGNTITISVDAATTTRNEFLAKLSDNFGTWLTGKLGATGEVNDGANIGASGASVFSTKNGLDLEFRKLDAISTYLSATVNGDKIDFDFDANQFANDLNFISDVQSVGGGAPVLKGITSGVAEIKSASVGEGILITNNTNELVYSVDSEWLNNVINSAIANGGIGGGGNGPAESSYLFRATKLNDQLIISKFLGDNGVTSLYGNFISFEDDVDNGNFDYGGSWGTNKFIHSFANAVNLKFIASNIGIENTSGGGLDIEACIIKELSSPSELFNSNGVAQLSDPIVNITNIASADRLSGVVTIVTTNPHNLHNGHYLKLDGFTDATYDSTSDTLITVVDSTTFTYDNAGSDGSSAVGGAYYQTQYIRIDTSVQENGILYISVEDDGGSDGAGGDEVRVEMVNGGDLQDNFVQIPPAEWDGRFIKLKAESITATPQEVHIDFNGSGNKFTGTIRFYDAGLKEIGCITDTIGAATTNTYNFSSSKYTIDPTDDSVKLLVTTDTPGVISVKAGGVFNNED